MRMNPGFFRNCLALLLVSLLLQGPQIGFAQSDGPCQQAMDVDSDGYIGIIDLLELLSVFGNSDLDFDCNWDNVDPCVNGEGDCPPIVIGPCEGLTTINYKGYDYRLVEVGSKCWFAENLRTPVYDNGDSIITHGQLIEGGASSGASYYPNLEDDGYLWTIGSAYSANFGFLYSQLAVMDPRGLCPSLWHVSQEEDWFELEVLSGTDPSDLYEWGFRGQAGIKNKSEAFWNTTAFGISGGGIDSLGLNLRPGGGAWPSTTYNNFIGTHAWFGTSTPNSEKILLASMDERGVFFNPEDSVVVWGPMQRELWHEQDGFRRVGGLSGVAAAVRCVKNPNSPGMPCNDGLYYTHYDIWPQDGTGNCVGVMSVDQSGLGPCNGEFAIEYHGHNYPLYERDDRCWFRSNLETLVFANGDSIPYMDAESWGSTTIGQVTDFNHLGYNGASNWNHLNSKFYNWAAASDERGICPSGWQIPSQEEWISLAVTYGNPAGLYDLSGTNLKGAGWINPLNSGGFSVLEVGHVYPNGLGNPHQSYFWTRDSYYPVMIFSNGFFENTGLPGEGNSIRCVKDLE